MEKIKESAFKGGKIPNCDVNKNILTRVQFPTDLLSNNIKFEKTDTSFTSTAEITEKIMFASVKEYDSSVFNKLYDTYVGLCDELIIINESEFERFIKKYLPIYLNEKKENKNESLNKNIIKLPLEEIRNLYLVEKLSCKEIATRYGVSSPTIRNRLNSLGVEIRKPQIPIYSGKKNNIPIEDLYYEYNLTLEEIGEIYHVSGNTIKNHLKAYDLPRRKPGQKKKNLPIDEIRELYLKGNTSSELAEKFNVGGTTILNLLHEQGVQIRNRHLAKNKEINTEESVYENFCEGCESEKYCHESCEYCDAYLEAMNDE